MLPLVVRITCKVIQIATFFERSSEADSHLPRIGQNNDMNTGSML